MREQSRTGRVVSVHRWLSAACVVAVAILVPAVDQAGSASAKTKSKLDRVLQRAVDKGDAAPRRVIVRPRPGASEAVADRVSKKGNRIEAAHRRLRSFTATVDADGLRALSADPDVENVSIDAILAAIRAEEDGPTSGEPNVLLE